MTRLILRVAPLLLLMALVGSCGPERGTFAPACPVPGLIKPLAELTRYRNGTQDIRDLIIRARIVDIIGKCKPGDDKGIVETTVQVVADVQRGPAFQGENYALPVFVAVTDGDTIRDKNLFYLGVKFQSNVDTAHSVGPEIAMQIPVTPQKSAAAYGIIGGFQLTPEEVAAYRRSARH